MTATAFVGYIIQLLAFTMFARAILSWFIMGSRNRFIISLYHALTQVTEPILAPLRKIMPQVGMIDLTPMIAFIVLQMVAAIFRQA